ncbi:MAG: thioredoxin family protein [Candidatus Geothermarchaeales archaeon]
MGHVIEVFTSGCPLCVETMEVVKKAKCPKCTLTEYNILERREDLTCIGKAQKYGIRAVPTIVIDGQVKIEGKPALDLVKRVLGT